MKRIVVRYGMSLSMCVAIVLAAVALTQTRTTANSAEFQVTAPEGAKYVQLPFLPRCMRVAMVQGNPRTSASVELARIDTGCRIPAHWHTSNTRLIFIRGYGTHSFNGGAPATIKAGEYIYLPARAVHSFRCLSDCLVYNIQDGPDIVHWIDAHGHDIPPAKAFSQ